MVCLCCAVSGLCSADFDPCEDRYTWCPFQSCHSASHDRCAGYGMGMVFLTHAQKGLPDITRKSWLFLILSGLATGASWLCYYKALQVGETSKVAAVDKLSVVITLLLAVVFLHEEFTVKSLLGCVLIGAGTLCMVL